MEPSVQHLKNIYGCVSVSVLTSIVTVLSVGVHLQDIFWITVLSTGGSTLFFLLLLIIPDVPDKNRAFRFSLLLNFAGFTGIGLGHLFKEVLKQELLLGVTAFLETSLIFCALSACAIFSEPGRWLFLGIPLTALLFTLIIVSFANIVDESRTVSRAIVYLSLFAMCGLVLYDTQMIIERFKRGDADFIGQTMNVFTDFIGIYRRLLIIGLEKEKHDSSSFEDTEDDEDFFFGIFSASSSPMHALL